MDIQLFNEARRFVLEYYFELGVGSIAARDYIWQSTINFAKGMFLWTRRGLTIFNKTLFFYSGEAAIPSRYALFSHNGFLEILGQWGLVGLIPYCLGVLAILIIDIYVAVKNYKVGIPALIIFGAFLGYTMVETSTLFDLTIEGITTTALVTLPALSWLNARRHPEPNRAIVDAAEEIEYKIPTFDRGLFEKQAARYLALFLSLITLFAFYYFRQSSSEISTYVMFLTIVITMFITLPRTLGNIYVLKMNKRNGVFWLLFSFTVLLNTSALFVLAYTTSPLVFLLTMKIIIIGLLITEKFLNKEKTPFISYLTKVVGQASVLLLAIVVSGSLVIFLYQSLTWFVLSEIVLLFIIVAIPIIREFNLKTSKLNNKMLLMFARGIGK